MRQIYGLLSGLLASLALSFSAFALIHFSQGSVAAGFSKQSSLGFARELNQNLSLNDPLLSQYKSWLWKFLQGDFSTSLISGEKVSVLLKNRLPYTLLLGGTAFILLVLLSLILGGLSLLSPSLDRLLSILGMSFCALPTFSLALLALLFLSVEYPLFPSSGAQSIGIQGDLKDLLWHLVLPASVLILSHLGLCAQFVRSTLLEGLKHPFVLFGLSRGLSMPYIFMHWVLKYSLSPIIHYFSALCVSFLMGTYVVEGIFAYGGIGNLLIQSLIYKDYPVVLCILLLSFLTLLILNCITSFVSTTLNQGRI